MFPRVAAAWFLTVLSTAFGQSVEGTVTYPDASAVPGAPVQAKNKATGAAVRTASGSDGRFAFANLAAGAYEISVAMPCCAYSPVVQSVTVEAGRTAQVNARLVETVNGSTLGDDPGRLVDAMRKRAKVPARPTPRSGGRPDLSGVWLVTNDPFPEQPRVLPWVEPIVKQRADGLGKDHPHNRCLPGSPPVPASSSPFIAKMVETPGLIVMLFEDVPGFRQIFLDGRRHPVDPGLSWMGQSTGKWEGDTLVVDTVGFNEQVWIGPPQGLYPHTEKLRMTERYTRTDFGHMEVRATFEDPGAFTTPLRETIKFDLAPQEELLEFVCENNKPQHLVGR